MSPSFALPLFQRPEHLRGIVGCLYLAERLDDNSVFVDQVCGSDNAHADFAVVFLFLPHAVSLNDFLPGV